MAECKVCGGTGKHKCTVCNGTKKIYMSNFSDRSIIYPEYYRVELTKCPYCDGTGYMKCSNCKGTGEE